MKRQKGEMKDTDTGASCTSKSRTNTRGGIEKKGGEKKELEEVGGKELRGRKEDVDILEFRAGSETNLAQIGLSTLAVNSK